MVKILFSSILTLNPKQIIMLLHKDVNKISELKSGYTHKWLEPDFIFSSLKCFSFSSLYKSLGAIKMKGYSFLAIFSLFAGRHPGIFTIFWVHYHTRVTEKPF